MKYFILTAFLCCLGLVAQTYPSSGFVDLEFTDESRGNRSIPVQVHYPENESGQIADEALPVLVFGHGFIMGIDAYENFVDELVREGYHLAFVDTEGTFVPNHEEFGKDLAFTLDALIELGADEASLFSGRVAIGGAVMGHSMGGGASFLATLYSDNIKTLLGFAPAETNPSAVGAAASMEIPTLIFAGTDDCVTPIADHQQPMYDALNSGSKKMIITIEQGTHCAFSSGNVACELGEQLTGCTQILDDQHQYFFPFVKTWLAATLKNNCIEWDSFWATYDDNTALHSGIESIEESGDLSFELDEIEIVKDETEENVFEVLSEILSGEVSWLVNGELVQTGGGTFEANESGEVQAVLNYGIDNCSVSSNTIVYDAVGFNRIKEGVTFSHLANENEFVVKTDDENVEFQLYSENGQQIPFEIEKGGNEIVLTYVSHYKGILVLAVMSKSKVFSGKYLDWID